MADEELELDVNESKGSKKTIIIIVIAFLLINGIGVGAWLFFAGGDGGSDKASNSSKADAPLAPLHYLTMVPEFVVNFGPNSKVRYLQVDLQVATRKESSLEIISTYRPQIRNDILILLSDVSYDDLKDRTGKEALQKRLLDAINTVVGAAEKSKESEDDTDNNKPKVDDQSVNGPIENVYFTSFIMQ